MMKKKTCILMGILVMSVSVLCGCKESESKSYTMSADYPSYDTAQDIVDSADLVFTGKVKGVTYKILDIRTDLGEDSMTGYKDTDPIPYTIYEIEPIRFYKGSTEEKTVYIKRPGGNFDNENYVLEDASEIVVDGEYLFLASTYANSYPSLVNATQASYNLNASSASTLSIGDNGNEITLEDILKVFE